MLGDLASTTQATKVRLEEDMATKLAAADAEAAEVRRQREMVEAQLREAQATAGCEPRSPRPRSGLSASSNLGDLGKLSHV
eukprot:COSAG04_NODE_3384_length_2869_cov_1.450181_2_plen_81_part_00